MIILTKLKITKKRFGPEGELYKKQDQLIRPIQDLIYQAISDLAEEGKYDIIFDDEVIFNTLPPLE